jgi:hypothetical protein
LVRCLGALSAAFAWRGDSDAISQTGCRTSDRVAMMALADTAVLNA